MNGEERKRIVTAGAFAILKSSMYCMTLFLTKAHLLITPWYTLKTKALVILTFFMILNTTA